MGTMDHDGPMAANRWPYDDTIHDSYLFLLLSDKQFHLLIIHNNQQQRREQVWGRTTTMRTLEVGGNNDNNNDGEYNAKRKLMTSDERGGISDESEADDD